MKRLNWLLEIISVFSLIMIPSGVSAAPLPRQSGVALEATGKICDDSNAFCLNMKFTFDPAGGPVDGSFSGSYTYTRQTVTFTDRSSGTLTGEFDGGDGGSINGTLVAHTVSTSGGSSTSSDWSGTWEGSLTADGTGSGSMTDSGGNAATWSVTFDGSAFEAALVTPEPTATPFTITGHEVKLSEMVRMNIVATPRIDEATKDLLKQDSVMIVRDKNQNFYAINNQMQAVQLPDAVKDIYDGSEKFAVLMNNGLLDNAGVTDGKDQINGGSQADSLAKMPASLQDRDYTGLTTLCYGYGEHKCRSELKINSTASSTHVLGGALGPSTNASYLCMDESGPSMIDVALVRSSEHGSIRGTINGGGCFIRVPSLGHGVETISLTRFAPSALRQTTGNEVYLGVQTLDTADSAIVQMVQATSPAEEAGLQINDLVTSVDGMPVDSQNTLTNLIGQYAPGTEVTLGASRDAQAMTFKVTLASILPSTVITPSAEITVNANTDLVVDIGFDGTTAVLVLVDTAHVRERGTGAETDVTAGSVVFVVPDGGIKGPIRVSEGDYSAWWKGEQPQPNPTGTTTGPSSGSPWTLIALGGCCFSLVVIIILVVVILVTRKKKQPVSPPQYYPPRR
jgi:hypothetical protein